MSYYDRKKAEKKAAMEKMQPEKDFNFCYANFFKPILHIISDAVEAKISNITNLNQTYIDIVKMISMIRDTDVGLQEKLESYDMKHIENIDNLINNSNETRDTKKTIIHEINKNINDYLINIYNAQIGFLLFKNLFEDKINGFNILNLSKKCKGDVEVSNVNWVRKDVCTYAPIALIKYLNKFEQQDNTLMIVDKNDNPYKEIINLINNNDTSLKEVREVKEKISEDSKVLEIEKERESEKELLKSKIESLEAKQKYLTLKAYQIDMLYSTTKRIPKAEAFKVHFKCKSNTIDFTEYVSDDQEEIYDLKIKIYTLPRFGGISALNEKDDDFDYEINSLKYVVNENYVGEDFTDSFGYKVINSDENESELAYVTIVYEAGYSGWQSWILGDNDECY